MNDNVSCGEIRFIEDAGFWVGCLRERELHGIAAAFENIAKERDSLRARVAELERERDRLALSLSATKAERDHAVRSAELLEDELHNSESARRDFEHAWLEGRAIMAVSMYFGRMRGPDAWLDHGSWDEYPELFACAGVDLRSFQHGTRFYAGSAPVPAAPLSTVEARYRDLLTSLGCNGHDGAIAEIGLLRRHLDITHGVGCPHASKDYDHPCACGIESAQAETKVADDAAVAKVLRDALRAQECNYLCQKSHFDDCLCRECVNERIRAMLAAKAKGE